MSNLKFVNVLALVIHLIRGHVCVLTSVISSGPSSVFKIVKMIMERNFQPVIIFSFSKKECEAYALQVAKLDFNRGIISFSTNLYLACHSGQICNIRGNSAT